MGPRSLSDDHARSSGEVALADIEAARARIAGKTKVTPVLTSPALDAAAGARLFFKCENLQQVGAFKARGAANAVFSLSDAEAERGVATHSSGNHGAALAWAAALRGVAATVVMPRGAAKPKVEQVEKLGARIVFCEPTLAAREAELARVVADTGAVAVHPYDDPAVIAGQGTAALELLDEVPDLDLVLAPVGGGGLLSGTAAAAKERRPGIRVIGAEPEGADDAARSFREGKLLPMPNPSTIADGLRAQLSQRTFDHIRRLADDVVTVSETEIIDAMRALWDRLKLVVEPSSAVPYAAIRSGKAHVRGLKVGVILTGGNVDLDHLPWTKPA
jgi:threonine dehydratase